LSSHLGLSLSLSLSLSNHPLRFSDEHFDVIFTFGFPRIQRTCV
jgi:hypothetical protein